MSYKIVNKFYVGGLQKFDQYTMLNPIDNNQIMSLLTRYKQKNINIALSSYSVIFILCSGLNNAKH